MFLAHDFGHNKPPTDKISSGGDAEWPELVIAVNGRVDLLAIPDTVQTDGISLVPSS